MYVDVCGIGAWEDEILSCIVDDWLDWLSCLGFITSQGYFAIKMVETDSR